MRVREKCDENSDFSEEAPHPIWIVYHNPLLERVLSASDFMEKAVETLQYSVYRTINYCIQGFGTYSKLTSASR